MRTERNRSELRELWLIRHGDTVATEQGLVAGRSDVPLSPDGELAVQALADELFVRGSAPFDVHREQAQWHVSPARRTLQSAAILLADANVELVQDARLQELDFGDWEGMSWSAVHDRHGSALAEWSDNWVERAPPGGESFANQARRCGDWLHDWCELQRTADDGARYPSRRTPTLVVTHGGSIRALCCLLLGWPLDRAMRFRIDPAHVCEFSVCPDTARGQLRRANQRRFA